MSGAPKAVGTPCSFPVSAPSAERSPLGRHSKPSRVRLPHGAPGAAAPALAGVAAAICLSPQAPAARPAAQTAVHHAAVRGAAHRQGFSPPRLLSAIREAKAGSGVPAWYTVRPGDSLSAIAGRLYDHPAAWPVLYWRNRGQIRYADIIRTGQVLRIPVEPARIPRRPSLLGPPSPPVRAAADYPRRHARRAAPVPQAAPVQAAAPAARSYSGGVPGGAFGQCVVARESGGQAQIMNSSGHYGLYQFSASTWDAYGGDPAHFGNAGAAEQSHVFANALASGGESNWAPYDGC